MARYARGPLSGRVSDAGRARAIEPGERPASESLRRTNPREGGELSAGYGDLASERLSLGTVLLRSPSAGCR